MIPKVETQKKNQIKNHKLPRVTFEISKSNPIIPFSAHCTESSNSQNCLIKCDELHYTLM